MAIANEASRSAYIGDGIAVDFGIGFEYRDRNHVHVYVDGVLVGPAEWEFFDDVTVRFTVPPAVDAAVVIAREVPYTQPLDFSVASGYPQGVIEHALDRLTEITQQLRDAATGGAPISAGVQWPPNANEGDVITWASGSPVWAPPRGGGGGEPQVRSSWSEADPQSLAFIEDKPLIPFVTPPGDGTIDVSYDAATGEYSFSVNTHNLAAHITARVATWALRFDTSLIDLSKIPPIPWGRVTGAPAFITSPITRPEPADAADASFDAIYGGGAGGMGQDFLSYKRLVADHTVRLTVHDLNAVGTIGKHGWASEAGLLQGNLEGGAVRPMPDGVKAIIEYRDGQGEWRVWLFTDETGHWSDPNAEFDLHFVEVGLGGATTTVRLQRDGVTDSGEWRSQTSDVTVAPRWVSGKQYDLQLRLDGAAADLVLHDGSYLEQLADETQLESLEGEILALIADLRHQPRPADWAVQGQPRPGGTGRTDEDIQDLVAAMFVNTESARVMYTDDPSGEDSAGTLSIDAPLPWTGRYLADLYDIDNLPSVPPAPAVAFDPDGGEPFFLTFRRWVTQTNPLSSIDHLPIGGFVGLRQGDELMVMRVLSPFDEVNSRYLVDVFHEANLAYTGASRGTEVLITAPNPYISIGYDPRDRNIIARFADATRQTIPLSNLTAFGEVDDEDVRLVDGHLLLEHDYGRLFLVLDAPAFEITSSELQDDLSSSDYITIPFAQGAGNRNQIWRGDGSRISLPWLFSGRIPESKIPRVVENINSMAFDAASRTFTLMWTDTDTSGTMDSLTSGALPEYLVEADLNDDILVGVDDATYDASQRQVVFTFDQHGGGTVSGKATLPQFLQQSDVEAWARGIGTIPDSAIGPDYITAGDVKPYARATYSGLIPTDALATGNADAATVLYGNRTWGALPQTTTAAPSFYKVSNSNVAFSTEGSRRRVNLTVADASSSAGTTVMFQWHEDSSSLADMEIEVGVNDAGYARIKHDNPAGGGLENVRLSDVAQFRFLMLHRAGSFWHEVGGTRVELARPWSQDDTTVLPIGKYPGGGAAGQALVLNSAADGVTWYTIPPPGISQSNADLRYVRLAGGGTVTGRVVMQSNSVNALEVIGTGSGTAAVPVLRSRVGTGRRIALQALNSSGAAWFELGQQTGGNARPGIGFGHSGIGSESAPDTELFRSNANEWTTPDKLIAAELDVSANLARTQGNLGLESFARVGTGNQIPTTRLSSIRAQAYTVNTAVWPGAKLGSGSAGTAHVLYWESGDTPAWGPLPSGGQYPGNDAVRDLLGAAITATAPLTWSYDAATHVGALGSSARTEAQVDAQIEARRDFEWCNVSTSATSTAYTLALDGEGDGSAPTTRILAINFIGTLNFLPQRPDSLPVRASYNGNNAGPVMLIGADGSLRAMTLGDLRLYGNTNVIHMFRRRSGSNWDWMGTQGAASATQDVSALIEPFARVGNTSQVTLAKVPNLDASKVTSGAFDTARLANAVTAARIIAEVDGTVGNNRIIGYDTSDAGLKWYDLPTGSGTDTNDFVNSLALALSGQELTLTAGRTGTLADLTASVTLPAGTTDTNDYVDTLALALSGQELTLTAGRTGALADLTASVTLPAGTTDTNDYVDGLALSLSGQELTLTAERTGTLADLTASVTLPAGTTDTNDYVDTLALAVSGQELTLTAGRTGSLADLTASVTLPASMVTDTNDYADSLAFVLQGQELTATIGRTGTLTDLTASVTLPAAMMSGLDAEQVRDTIAAFAVPGDNMHIVHRDTDNELIFSASPPVEFTIALFINSTWDVFAVNVDSPGLSYQVGRLTGVPSSLFQGATWHDGEFVATTQHVRNNGLWTVNLDTLVATRVPGQVPDQLQDARGIASHNGTVYIAMGSGTSRGLWRINLGNLSASARIGGWPAGVTGNIRDLFSFGGKLYMVMANRDLWDIDTGTPADSTRVGAFAGSSLDLGPFVEVQGRPYFHEDDGLRSADLDALTLTDIGDFPGSFGVVQAGTHVTTGLTTTFIREGSRPYYSDALVDAWADSNFDDRWDDRLSWAMAPAGDPTVVAQKVNVDGVVYGLRNTFSFDTPGALPTPGILTRGQGYYCASNETLYWGVREHHLPTPGSGTFDTLPARSDMHVVTAQPGNLNAYDVGDFLFINSDNWRIGGGTFAKVVSVSGTKQLQDTSAGEALADWKTAASQDVDFLGREATSTDALEYTHSVEAGKDYFWFDTTNNEFRILDQSTYVAPTGAVDHDRLKPVAGPGAGGVTDTNDYLDSLAFVLSGQSLTLTAGRTGTLADLTATVTLPEGSNDYLDSLAFVRSGQSLTLTAGRTGTLSDLTASVTLPAPGIVESDADARYARLTAANTFEGLQTIDRNDYTGEHPALNIIVGSSGDRKALQFHNEDNATAWGSFEFALGSIDKPGLALGPGDGGRDVELYRDAADVWRTPDAFRAGVFDVDGDGAEETRSNLGVMGRATDNTMEGTGEDDDPLKVSVQHVIEHSSERVRYVTDASFYSTRGSTVMQIFNTGPFTYRVTHVSWDLDAPATGITARCRLYTLNDNNTVREKLGDSASRGFSERGSGHYLYFATGGILVPPNSRVGVGFSRTDESSDSACFLKAGGEQANSPEHSYNNAQEDWRYLGWGEYEHTDPGVGDGTVAHDTDGNADVYGNANIHYSLVIDHGQIVGDGTVDETHINAENADEGDVLTANDANPRRGVWSPPPKDVVLASDFEVDFAARVEQDLSRDFDDFNWIAVIAGESDADYGTYLRVPRSSVTEFVSGVEMLGWVMDNDADTVRLYEVDPSDGSLTPRGPSQSLSNRQWQGAGLAWVGTDLIGWVLDNDNDTVRLYDVDPADGVFTARSSSRSLGGGDWRGAGLAWTGSALLGWVITDGADTARLYEVDLADGSISARGSSRSIGSGSWRGAAVAWTGSELLGWVMDNQTDRVRLYEVDTSDGSLTARGSARSLGSGSWLGAGLAWTGFELLGWAVDNAVNTVQLYTVDTSDGTLTARGSARALGDGVYTGLDLVYRDTSSGGASGAGLRIDREDDDTIGVTALTGDMYIHQVIGIP